MALDGTLLVTLLHTRQHTSLALSSSLQWENVLELRTNKQNVLTLIHMIQGGQWPLLSWYMAHSSSYVVNMEN